MISLRRECGDLMASAFHRTAIFVLVAFATAAIAEPPPLTSGPVDGLVSSPDNFRLLLENDHVRVVQYSLQPGARDHWHTHPPRVGYVLSGAKIRVTKADGSQAEYDEKTGDSYWGEFSPLHDTLNIDIKPYIALLVEVKGADSASAPADPDAEKTALAAAARMSIPARVRNR